MSLIAFDPMEVDEVQIKVVGVGGGGGNAVNRMVRAGVQGVEFVAVNTDAAVLKLSQADQRIQIGEKLTRGMGAGGNPEKGQRAAEESRDEIAAILKGANMIFITAGMGGGTGTGAAPVVAEIARDLGILTVGIVSKPFAFEGRRRMEQAESGIAALRENVDSLVVIPNERIKLVSEQRITLANAFEMADDVLRQGVQSISQLIKVPGLVNLDFADVTSIMKDAGYAHMGVGRAEGKDRAELAARQAVASPLLETSIDGARGVLINVTGTSDLDFEDVDKASEIITSAAHPDATIIWGAAFDETLGDTLCVTVIATGLVSDNSYKAKQPEDILSSSTSPAAEGDADPTAKIRDDDYGSIIDIFTKKNKGNSHE